MRRSGRRMLAGALFLLLTAATGTIGYVIAGWNLLDAIYMVVITIFGVGYGEVRQLGLFRAHLHHGRLLSDDHRR
jgi:voltage-gated potassium channel